MSRMLETTAQSISRTAKRLGLQAITLLAGVAIGLAVNALWEVYTAPELRLAYGMAAQTFASERMDNTTIIRSEVRDSKTGDVAVRTLMQGPDSVLQPGPESEYYFLKFILKNGGRKALHGLRIPVHFTVGGDARVTSTSNVHAYVEDPESGPLHVIVVDALQPQSVGVITYAKEASPSDKAHLFRISAPYVAAQDIGIIAFPDTLTDFGLIIQEEGRLTPGGGVVAYFSAEFTGKGGPLLPSSLQLVPEYFAAFQGRVLDW